MKASTPASSPHLVALSRRHLVILLSALLLLSCQLFTGALTSTKTSPNEDTIYLMGRQPRTMDPAKTLGGPDSPLGHIFSGLVAIDTDMQVQPELAAGWEVSDNGRIYTFYLRKNGVFHDGRPVTAADIIYSWERAADPATGSDTVLTYLGDVAGVTEMNGGETDRISGLRALDDYTLEVTLREPIVYFLQKLAYPVAYVVDKNNVADPDWEHNPNGTGPFRLAVWRDDAQILLARNEAYYLEPARVGFVSYDLGPGLALSLYEQGKIDLVGVGGANLERMQDPNNPLHDQLRQTVSFCTSVIGLNNRLAPFDDARVRQAFNYALDKELLINTFSGGDALPATGSLPPGMPGYTNNPNRGYPYDPAKARQLLADAGYADMSQFPVLTYSTGGYGSVNDYVTAVITMWQENLGVTIKPEVIDPYQYYDELYSGNVGHFFGSGWCADYPDPQNFLDILYHSGSTQNIGGYSNPKVDAMLEAARVERDTERRMALYAEIEDRIVAGAPVVFVSHGLTAVLVSPDLAGYVLTPFGVRQWHRVGVNRN
ncbi:MAG: peptide ABC transporter substrate-binding protein [Chloroflexi bacterium]|nr:peptide ABC transporter substrate-binding protein [Chloroflexota bacterium]